MKLGAIIQARSGSIRLPGKVMLPLPYKGEVCVLHRIIERVRACALVDEVIVATTKASVDNAVVDLSRAMDVAFFTGSENDVLDRYYQAARNEKLDVIVRICGDKPCLDPNVMELMIQAFLDSGADYMSNFIELTYPQGLEVEVFHFDALRKSHQTVQREDYREHVTPEFYRSGDYEARSFICPEARLSRPDIRLTLDTIEDYTLICAVYDYLGDRFGHTDIVALFEDKPWLLNINANVRQKEVYDSVDEELSAAIDILKPHDLNEAVRTLTQSLVADRSSRQTVTKGRRD